MIFLITYDTGRSELIEIREFADEARSEATLALRSAQEQHISELDNIEIAVFEAPSRATLERTHSRYFKTLAQLGDAIEDLTRRSA